MQTDTAQPSEGDDHPVPASRPRRSLLVAAVLVVGITLMAVVLVAERGNDDDAGLAVGAASVQQDAPEPSMSVSVTPAPTLPIPDALPTDAHAPTPDVVVGHIEIPKIGVDEDIHQGITLTSIDRGPGWWPGTAMPGQLGNMVIAGHRVTHSKPFNRLDELTEGDQVIFTTDAGRFTYEVRGVIIVPADWIDIAAQDYAHTATLFACHPKGRATHRVVAKLRLLDDQGNPVDPDSALPPLNAEEQRTDHTLVVRKAPSVTDQGPTGGDPLAGVDG